MGARALTLLLLVASCGGNDAQPDAQPDAPNVRWTWTFRDADGNDVGCPPGVTTVEMTHWNSPHGPGDGCANTPNPTIDFQQSVPCEPGVAVLATTDIRQMDFKLDDGRVYARAFPTDHHAEVLTPRGFVALSWSFYDHTTMMPTWCTATVFVTSTWLQPHDRFLCTKGSPTMTVLPGQPVGNTTFDVWLDNLYEACGADSVPQTVPVSVLADQTINASVQFAW